MNLDKKVPDFLKLLVVNNNREWFNDNKELFLEAKALFEDFIQAQIVEISKFDSQVKDLSVKDCSFRIYRDLRFSKDKTPYKIHFSAYMARGGRKSQWSGYYTHVEPDMNIIAGGLHHPEKSVLDRVRRKIYTQPETFKKIINNSAFKTNFPKIYGEQLKSAPRGYDKNFKDLYLIRFKSYDFFHYIDDEELVSDGFFEKSIQLFKLLYPLNNYFNLGS